MDTVNDSKNLGLLEDPEQFNGPLDVSGSDPSELVRDLAKLMEIRCAEEKIGDEFGANKIKCPCHLVIGQEAPAVALARAVSQGDKLFGAHRSHAHYLALGGSLYSLFAEVLGKDDGCSKGMGGSMHLLDRARGLYGTVPIVGATIPIATGAALAAKMDGHGVAVSFLGDGATEEGVFHESLNLASVKKLPVIFVVENNLFSSHLHIKLRQPFSSVCRFADANGIKWYREDGNDLVQLKRIAKAAVAAARTGEGPQLIEAVTYRWRGHVGHREDNDVGVMRKEGLAVWKMRDPINRLAQGLMAAGAIDSKGIANLLEHARSQVEDAWRKADQAPYPTPNALLDRVFYNSKA